MEIKRHKDMLTWAQAMQNLIKVLDHYRISLKVVARYIKITPLRPLS